MLKCYHFITNSFTQYQDHTLTALLRRPEMTDPLLCPRIPLNIYDFTDYSCLNNTITGANEKLAILDEYLIRINKATRFKPATFEFIKHFDMDQAADIMLNYYHIDSFFRRMTQGFFMPGSLKCISLPDAYFLLIELKCYINERQAAIIKSRCVNTFMMIEQYQNHFSFNPPTIHRIEMNLNNQQLMHPDFFVPETILFTDEDSVFTVNDAIQYTNHLIKDIQNLGENQIDLDICSFFENFRNLLFNNQNDIFSPDIVEKACKYALEASSSQHQSPFSSHVCPCRYASFVETLAYIHKNNLSHTR